MSTPRGDLPSTKLRAPRRRSLVQLTALGVVSIALMATAQTASSRSAHQVAATATAPARPIPGLPFGQSVEAGSLKGLKIGYFNFKGDPFTDATTADVKAQVEKA